MPRLIKTVKKALGFPDPEQSLRIEALQRENDEIRAFLKPMIDLRRAQSLLPRGHGSGNAIFLGPASPKFFETRGAVEMIESLQKAMHKAATVEFLDGRGKPRAHFWNFWGPNCVTMMTVGFPHTSEKPAEDSLWIVKRYAQLFDQFVIGTPLEGSGTSSAILKTNFHATFEEDKGYELLARNHSFGLHMQREFLQLGDHRVTIDHQNLNLIVDKSAFVAKSIAHWPLEGDGWSEESKTLYVRTFKP